MANRSRFYRPETRHPILRIVLGTAFTIIFIPCSVVAAFVAIVHAFLPVAKVPLKYNLRNLHARWKTTVVTALAFTLVVGLVATMLAFVRGMERLTESSGRPGNVMILSDGAVDETFSNLPNASLEELPSDMQAVIEKTDGGFLATKEVYVVGVYTIPVKTEGPPKRRYVQMRGLDDVRKAAILHGVELDKGAWLSPSGVHPVTLEKDGKPYASTAKEVILGNGIARTFGTDVGKPTLVPGDTVQIGPDPWYVVGIMKENNSSFGSEIWALDTHVQSTFGRGLGSYSSFVAHTKSEQIGSEAAKALRDPERSGPRAYNALTEQEYFAKLTASSDFFRGAIMVIAFVLTIGGVLGVMNTMFAAISQRTKDIGILRLLGFQRFQILCSFLMESLVIALVGGLVGLAVSYLLVDGTTVNSIVSGQSGGGKSVVLRMTVDLSVLLSAGVLTFFMGAVGGFIPSVSAMRLRPLESLR